jgi:hypothetical protein
MRNRLASRFSRSALAAAALLVGARCVIVDFIPFPDFLAAAAAQTVSGAVNLLLNSQSSWTRVGPTVAYSTTGLSMNGKLSLAGTINTYALVVTFSNYVDAATGYTMNGTGPFSYRVDTANGSVSGTVSGTFVFSGGAAATQTWNVVLSGTRPASPVEYSGTVTCNGTSFDAANLSLGSTSQANSALQGVFFGIEAVMSGESSWTAGAGDGVSYSVPGVTMTGFRTNGPAAADYELSITFMSYFDAQSGCTLEGTVDLVLACTNPGVIDSGTLTGSIMLSGGPLEVIGFNVTDIVGISGGSVALRGFVFADGTTFDAKTFVPG